MTVFRQNHLKSGQSKIHLFNLAVDWALQKVYDHQSWTSHHTGQLKLILVSHCASKYLIFPSRNSKLMKIVTNRLYFHCAALDTSTMLWHKVQYKTCTPPAREPHPSDALHWSDATILCKLKLAEQITAPVHLTLFLSFYGACRLGILHTHTHTHGRTDARTPNECNIVWIQLTCSGNGCGGGSSTTAIIVGEVVILLLVVGVVELLLS